MGHGERKKKKRAVVSWESVSLICRDRHAVGLEWRWNEKERRYNDNVFWIERGPVGR